MFQKRYRELVDAEKYEEAITLAEKRINFDKPLRKWWRDPKAFCLIKLWKYEEAIQIYKRRLDFEPNDTHALLSLAMIYSLNIEDYQIALKYINKCLLLLEKEKIKFTGHYLMKAKILHKLWKYPLAIQYYQKELSTDPKQINKEPVLKWIEECREIIKKIAWYNIIK